MKMSDVFNLPLSVLEPITNSHGGWPVVSASVKGESVCGHMGRFEITQGQYSGTSRYLDIKLAKDMAESAACAVNNHDRMVEEIAELRSFVKKVSELDIETFHFENQGGDEDCFEYVCTDIVDDAVELLAKLNQEGEE